jgi:hypothetical protein
MTSTAPTPAAIDLRVKGHEAANNAWEVYRATNVIRDTYPPDMVLELHEAFTAGFTRGARWSFAESAKLAPAIAALSDFLDWLRSQ